MNSFGFTFYFFLINLLITPKLFCFSSPQNPNVLTHSHLDESYTHFSLFSALPNEGCKGSSVCNCREENQQKDKYCIKTGLMEESSLDFNENGIVRIFRGEKCDSKIKKNKGTWQTILQLHCLNKQTIGLDSKNKKYSTRSEINFENCLHLIDYWSFDDCRFYSQLVHRAKTIESTTKKDNDNNSVSGKKAKETKSKAETFKEKASQVDPIPFPPWTGYLNIGFNMTVDEISSLVLPIDLISHNVILDATFELEHMNLSSLFTVERVEVNGLGIVNGTIDAKINQYSNNVSYHFHIDNIHFDGYSFDLVWFALGINTLILVMFIYVCCSISKSKSNLSFCTLKSKNLIKNNPLNQFITNSEEIDNFLIKHIDTKILEKIVSSKRVYPGFPQPNTRIFSTDDDDELNNEQTPLLNEK
ncbi:hypothetical protein M0813_28887 [Anaeramoeba flamelloides]|uniref:Uncharacterized protein n=1 Tax=Anaeramoeba flamelloides TaxID=1746091 RepID=A0ABQ8XQM0_9EUKA|nr:hypothetical protein M0813_28887 [Anaeramoeba flamelloides]